MSLSKEGFYKELEKLPSYQQDIINKCFGDRLPQEDNKRYISPTIMLKRVVAFLKGRGKTELLNPCRKCGGTGLYDSHTSYTDTKGAPYCFSCGGSGYRVKRLSVKKMEELKTLLS